MSKPTSNRKLYGSAAYRLKKEILMNGGGVDPASSGKTPYHQMGMPRNLEFMNVANAVCNAHALPIGPVVYGRDRMQEHMSARAHIARELVKLGWNHCAIGRQLGRDHSTVHYWLHGKRRQNVDV